MADHSIYSDFAYDDAFRTMESECDDLLIPFINYFFDESYDRSAEILHMRNEHFVERDDQTAEKRVTDSYVKISQGGTLKAYHLECESKKYDGSVLVRLFEYDAQIAIDESKYTRTSLRLDFPNTGLLILRDSRVTPREAEVIIRTPGGEVKYNIPIIREADFTVDDIFDKQLYFLLPFYIFNHEKLLKEYDKDAEKLDAFLQMQETIIDRLHGDVMSKCLSSLSCDVIIRLIRSVAYKLTAKTKNVQMRMEELMGGKVLDLDVIRAHKEGKAEGREEGKAEGREEGRAEGRETGIRAFIEDKVEDGVAEATIIDRLWKRFHLERSDAESYIRKYAPAAYSYDMDKP